MPRLSVAPVGENRIVVRRDFAAPPQAVFHAHLDAALIPRWMNIMEGWSMPVVESDPHPGGGFRFQWDDGQGGGFRIEGDYLEIEAPHRILHVERMFLPDRMPDNRVETLFQDREGGTHLRMTMTLPDKAARDAMLQTGMTDGMEMTYARLDLLLAGEAAG
jgi:uncharacterized protein YndB with AHSA1/START domain